MSEIAEKIATLQSRLENLVKSQAEFQRDLNQIRNELHALRIAERNRTATPPDTVHEQSEAERRTARPHVEPSLNEPAPPQQRSQEASSGYGHTPNFGYQKDSARTAAESRSQFEKFVGENLISKIGIAILVIGVGIGTKYAIDNNLISPATRIVLGYLLGFGLIGFAIRLKLKYLNFSAVLLSGGMAIMYFVTYFAFSLYQLIDQTSAFALMAMFTVFTIAAALLYNRQIIAHLGLVGAYAVPFLLSDDSGRYAFFFTYVAIINIGILAISVYQYWKPLFYTSFIFTWLIYYSWLIERYTGEHFTLGLTVLFVFFTIFYATFLIYKVISAENITVENVGLVTANAFIFYGLGYALLDGHGNHGYLGLFTAANAILHLVAAFITSRTGKVPVDLIYLQAALVLTFATIAVPVQFEGRSVTLIWSAEAAILFAVGRLKQIRLYEYCAFPLIFLATLSLYANWVTYAIESAASVYPIANGLFVTGLFYVVAISTIFYVNRIERFEPAGDDSVRTAIRYVVGALVLLSLYNLFRTEIATYFAYEEDMTAKLLTEDGYSYSVTNHQLSLFSYVWQINYSMVFLTVLALVNIKRVRDVVLAAVNIATGLFWLMIFLTAGLYVLGDLRHSYLHGTEGHFPGSIFNIVLRYVSLACAAGLLYALREYSADEYVDKIGGKKLYTVVFDAVVCVSLLIILSSELVHWMDMFGYSESYKLGMSIIWGAYALALVGVGISRGKQHLRIGAIILLALTLAKLFLYDIGELSTVARTVVFVSLGILMLIVSFLYTKYKHVMFGPDAT